MEHWHDIKPVGWANPTGGRGLEHFFAADGKSLCGRYVSLSAWNILSADVYVPASNRCKKCNKIRTKGTAK